MSAYGGVDVTRLLVEGMRTCAMNHRIIANNIANAETPNYTPQALDFQGTLQAALEGRDRVPLRRTQARHLEATRALPEFERIAILSKNDYNKVDLDAEVARLSENTGRYTVYSSLLTKRFQVMKNMLNNIR